MSCRAGSAGELLEFEILADGSVMLSASSTEDDYARPVLLSHREIAGIAEASAGAFRTRTVECTHCHLGRPAFELNNFGICIVCVNSR